MSHHLLRTFLEFAIPPAIMGGIAFWVMYWLLKRRRTQLVVSPGIRTSNWIMVGGDQSKVYYDIDKACSSLDSMAAIDNWYLGNIREINEEIGIDGLAFIEREDGPVGAITKKDKLSSELGIASFIVRPRRRIKAATLKGITEDAIQGKKVVIVSDVTTTGHSADKVIQILENFGARVVAVVTIVNRGSSKTENLFREKSIEFRYAEDNLDRYLAKEAPQQT